MSKFLHSAISRQTISKEVLLMISHFFCGLILCVCMSSCSKQDNKQDRKEETVLTFWAMGSEGEFVAQLLPEFERTHPSIKVKLEQLPWSAAQLTDMTRKGQTLRLMLGSVGPALAHRNSASGSHEPERRLCSRSSLHQTKVADVRLVRARQHLDARGGGATVAAR